MSPLRLSWRLVWRGATIWSVLIVVTVFSGALGYKAAYRSEAARRLFVATLGHSRALDALYGQGLKLDTPGGFTAWRYGTAIFVVASLWTLLAVTRLLRGEEEQGRADPLLAAPVRPRRLLGAQLVALAVGVGMLALGTTAGCLAAALPATGSVLLGVACGAVAATFGGLAMVSSQLFDSRRRAAGVVGALLGASFILRALGDGSDRARWLVWASPIGWAEELHPFATNRPAPLLLLFGMSAGLIGLAFWLRGYRDTGDSVVQASTRTRRMRPVASASRLDWRLARGGLLAWVSGVLFYGLLLGYLAGDIARFARGDKNINDLMARLGGASVLTVNGFLGLTFSLVGVVLAVYAGSQISAGRSLESDGHVEPLVTGGVSRVRWLSTRAGVGVLSTVVLAVCAGVSAWAGAELSGEGARLASAVGGALNVVPVAMVFGGLTVLAFGAVPRYTAATAFGAVAVTYLIQFVGAIANAPGWFLDLSPFQHVAAVPFHPVNVTSTLIMLGSAMVLFVLGTASFRRRDLAEI
jgi:ABC-2 type transport system permease protein